MTTGVVPHCETANLPARQFGWPPEPAHPSRDKLFYTLFNRQLRANGPALVARPDDRLREAIQRSRQAALDCLVATLPRNDDDHPASAVSASRTQYDVPSGMTSSLKS